MSKQLNFLYQPRIGRLVMILSILVSAFWILGSSINVYQSPAAGMIFELLWLPMLLLIVFLPVAAVLILLQKNTPKLFPFLSLLIIVISFLYLTLFK